MITDDNKDVLSRSDLVLLRDRKLRDFLTVWIKRNSNSTHITIEEIVLFNDSLTDSRKQVSILLPLNVHELETGVLVDYITQQLYEKITDIPWDKNICDFSYVEVLFSFSDYASLYPSTLLANSGTIHVLTPDRYYTKPFTKHRS